MVRRHISIPVKEVAPQVVQRVEVSRSTIPEYTGVCEGAVERVGETALASGTFTRGSVDVGVSAAWGAVSQWVTAGHLVTAPHFHCSLDLILE